jgi:hypothetical protein
MKLDGRLGMKQRLERYGAGLFDFFGCCATGPETG